MRDRTMKGSKATARTPSVNSNALPWTSDLLARLPEKAFLDEQALATAFNVSPRTIKRWIRRGEIPWPVLVGRRRLWMAGRVLAFIESRIADAEKLGQESLASRRSDSAISR